ncbi:MAG: porin family protein [Burkholderiales bacterium]|jgi:opacity protein-like surface antigen|nr:porin family protein [Burkholderiales bacterium]
MTLSFPLRALAAAMIAGVAASPVLAQADVRESGWYIGGGIGASRFSLDNASFATSEVGRAIGLRGTSSGDSDSTSGALKFFGGYDFNRYLGAEAAVVGLGGVTVDFNNASTGAQVGSTDYSVGAFTLAGVGRYEFDNGFLLKGKLGVAFTSAVSDYTVSLPGGTQRSNDPSANKTNFYWGLSAGYSFTRHWAVLLDYEDYGTVGNDNVGEAKLQSLMASVQYRF